MCLIECVTYANKKRVKKRFCTKCRICGCGTNDESGTQENLCEFW